MFWTPFICILVSHNMQSGGHLHRCLPCLLACIDIRRLQLHLLKYLGAPRITAIWQTTFWTAWLPTGYL